MRADTVAPPVFVVLWSSAFVAGMIGLGAAPPLLLTFARFLGAAVLLAALALVLRWSWPPERDRRPTGHTTPRLATPGGDKTLSRPRESATVPR